MFVTTAAATSPWWLTPAVNTAGIGLLMLNDYLRNRGLSGSSSQNPISAEGPIQWRDGSVGGIETGLVPSTPNFDAAKSTALNTSATTALPFITSPVIDFGTTPIETETKVDFSPPPKPPKNTGNKNDDDKYWKAARGAALWELGGKAFDMAVGGEEEVPVTEGPGTKLITMPDDSVRRVPVDQNIPGSTVMSVDGVPVTKPSITEKVDKFLSPKDAWLLKTRNSPAQQSGAWDSDEGREQLWQTHLANQQWRKDKGRSFTHGELLK